MGDRKDLTRLENLSEFLHQDDPDVDARLDLPKKVGLDDLPAGEEEKEEDGPPSFEEFKPGAKPPTPPPEPEAPPPVEEPPPALDLTPEVAPEPPPAEEPPMPLEESPALDFPADPPATEAPAPEASQDFALEAPTDPAMAHAHEKTAFPDGPAFEAVAEAEPAPEPEAAPAPEPEPQSFEPPPEDMNTSFRESPGLEEEPPAPAKPAPPEKFEDVRKFAQSIAYGAVGATGNPPFSIMLKKVRYKEDAEDILAILRQHGVANDANQEAFEKGLALGQLLVSQISEFAAVYLAHRMRRFDVEILMGPADELHPSKSYTPEGRGLVRKENLGQNREEAMDLEHLPAHAQDVLLSTTAGLEGHKVLRYLGTVTGHAIVEEALLAQADIQTPTAHDGKIPEEYHLDLPEEIARDMMERAPGLVGPDEVYSDLANSLRAKALALRANAVVGIAYQLTPMIGVKDNKFLGRYKVTCAGTAVWATRGPDHS